MARFDKFQVMAKIAAAPMVPVFYHKDVEVCKNVIKACYAGGVRAFEFTNRGDFAHEVLGSRRVPCVGAGYRLRGGRAYGCALSAIRCELRGRSAL